MFHKNHELAGYCSVLHALQLGGLTGSYGRRLRAVVISFGATARGAVTGLGAMGVSDVTVLTQRAAAAVASPMPSVVMGHYEEHEDDPLVGPGCHYYGVDHSPSHLWNSATWEISEALLPYLRKVMSTPLCGWSCRSSGRGGSVGL